MTASRALRKVTTALYLLLWRPAPAVVVALVVPKLQRWDVFLPLAALTLWMVLESLSENEHENRRAVRSTQDRGSRFSMLGAHVASWWLPLVELLFSPTLQMTSRIVVGLGLIAVGGGLRVVAVLTLGPSFTAHVQVSRQQEVCRTGIYSVVRHPSYIGLVLLNAAPAIATGTWYALAVSLGTTLGANYIRVRVEEGVLREELGRRYADYSDAVPRWLPQCGSATQGGGAPQ